MVPKSIKYLIIVFSLFISRPAFAQDFYKAYKSYLIGDRAHLTSVRMNLIDSSVRRLYLTLNRFKKEKGQSFFTTDTVYLVGFTGVESGYSSKIIWNKRSSCYFEYSFEMENNKITNQKLDIKTDASEILNSFSPEFRNAVEHFDTTAYLKYADRTKVYDGSSVASIMAVRKGSHWQFKTFRGNGWAFDVEDVFNREKKKQTNATLTEAVKKLIKNNLHINIDSVKTACLNDPACGGKPLPYPVIVWQGKIIDFTQINEIEVWKIKSFNILTGNDPKAAVYGDNSKYGVIIIEAK